MDDYQIVYIVVALFGTFIYNYAGYLRFGKSSGEKFDWSKWLSTVLQGGGLSSVLTYVASVYISGSGFSIFLLINAFVMGLSFPAGLDKLGDVISPKQPSAINVTSIIARLEALNAEMKAAFSSSPSPTTATSQANIAAATPIPPGMPDSSPSTPAN
jgi:hypothetical protein